MVRLRKVVPSHCADVLVKLEWDPHRQPGNAGDDEDQEFLDAAS